MPKNSNIGQLLVHEKVITQEQLNRALKVQHESGKKLGAILVEAGAINDEQFLEYTAKELQLPFVDLNHYPINQNLSLLLPENYARRFRAILLAETEGQYLVGMADPLDIFATDELFAVLKTPLKLALISEKALENALNQLYRRSGEITDFAGKLASELTVVTTHPVDDDAIKQAEPAVIKLLNSVFEDAMQIGASDIHIEPAENYLRIRMRVDGILQEQIIPAPEQHITMALCQRLKLMAGLNIAEKRLPQDGRFDMIVRNTSIDVRLSFMPMQYGESIVMRILSKANNVLDLSVTGMPKKMLDRFRHLIKSPHGIILVTGPTGSGKTTTLYGALAEISDVSKNIITIEDPIEYRLERANQVQVNAQIGLTFARVLRAALRQDPNIILVGEIRDQETASIALRAALTGHLVFATLHTNDAASTAIRLIDIGVEGYLVASTIKVILAQRLVRCICSSCSEHYTPTDYEASFFSTFFGDIVSQNNFNRGAGCTHCNFTGYKGRVGVFELLELDHPMRDALRRKDTNEFANVVEKNRTTPTLLANAFELARQGITTLSEVMRVAGEQL